MLLQATWGAWISAGARDELVLDLAGLPLLLAHDRRVVVLDDGEEVDAIFERAERYREIEAVAS